MSAVGLSRWSLRLEQAEVKRLAWAIALSLAAHLLIFGTYQAGKRLHWWEDWRWPTWVKSPPLLTQVLKKPQPVQPAADLTQQIPLMFVDVDPAAADPPKDAKYYSDKNSIAANPSVDKESDTPKIDGKQEHVVRTEDVPREKPAPLQPAPVLQQVQKALEDQTELIPKPTMTPGDLALGNPEPLPNTGEGKDELKRPRTIKEALARKNPSRLAGEKLKQEGGVRRHLEISSLDAKATLFGSYDRALIEAISQKWYSLLDERGYASDSRGRVILQFQLHHDGRITDMKVAENTSGEMLGLICQQAVLWPAPFAPWPLEMRRALGDTRSIQFTFYYN